MRTKVTLVLIFLNVALFFFIFKFERNWRTEAASLEARRRVLGPEAADIRMLEVTNHTANTSFRLVRIRDNWSLTEPLEWPANPHAASSIVTELGLLEHEASFRVDELQNTSLADYGLDKPKMTVAFASGDASAMPTTAGGTATPLKTFLRIGDTTKDGKRLYVLSPNGERVHVVKRSLIDSLSVPLQQLRADTLLSVRVFEAQSLLIHTASPEPSRAGGAGVRVRIRRDGNRWRFETPITAYANKVAIELVINELNALSAKSFQPAGSGSTPATSPAMRITIQSNNNRHETLYLGEKVASSAPAGTQPATVAGPVEYLAQLEGRNALFTVAIPPNLLETLRNAQDALRERRILDFEPAAVTALTVSAPVLAHEPPVTLQRLEPAAGQPASVTPSWQIVRRAEAQAGAQTWPADRSAVQRILERLSLLSADRFKSDAPTSADLEDWGFNRPVREVTLMVTANATPLILRLGTDAARNVYARVGNPNDPGTSIYQVSSDILADLPLTPLSWRDRAVAEPLPAAARVTSLKLTDLEAKTILYETKFTATGEPVAASRDPKSVLTVVGLLRALRAKDFVPGGFAEKVNAAGDDRPWRFQLDAEIVLPSAGGLDQTSTLTVFLSERLGGSLQYAGVKPPLDAVFSLEQPVIDALWTLAYGTRDPGAPVEPKK